MAKEEQNREDIFERYRKVVVIVNDRISCDWIENLASHGETLSDFHEFAMVIKELFISNVEVEVETS